MKRLDVDPWRWVARCAGAPRDNPRLHAVMVTEDGDSVTYAATDRIRLAVVTLPSTLAHARPGNWSVRANPAGIVTGTMPAWREVVPQFGTAATHVAPAGELADYIRAACAGMGKSTSLDRPWLLGAPCRGKDGEHTHALLDPRRLRPLLAVAEGRVGVLATAPYSPVRFDLPAPDGWTALLVVMPTRSNSRRSALDLNEILAVTPPTPVADPEPEPESVHSMAAP